MHAKTRRGEKERLSLAISLGSVSTAPMLFGSNSRGRPLLSPRASFIPAQGNALGYSPILVSQAKGLLHRVTLLASDSTAPTTLVEICFGIESEYA